MLPAHQGGEIGLVGDVEEHGQDARDERDDEQLDERERTERVGDRNGAEREHPPDVGRHHHPAAPDPVDPDACGQPDDEEGRGRRRGEERHLEGGGVQRADGEEGDGEKAHLGAELAHRLAPPEQAEVSVP